MSDVAHRKEVLAEVERLGFFDAIDAAENLVKKVRRQATATGSPSRNADPIPPVENIDDSFASASEAIRALKRTKPKTHDEARARSAELMRLNQILIQASKQVVDANAAKRISSGSKGNASAGITDGTLKALARGLVQWLKPQLDEIGKRLGELEQHTLSDGGTWKPDKAFKPNQVVTYRGVLWICLKETSSRPGNDCWRLMTKTEGR